MSKRNRASQAESDEEHLAKRPRFGWTARVLLLDVFTTSGIGDALYASFDALTQRALCCASTEYHRSLSGPRAPLPWPVPSFPQHVDDHGFQTHCAWQITKSYWRSQISLALHYDHVGRLDSILDRRYKDFRWQRPYPNDQAILYWATQSNAVACVRALRSCMDRINMIWCGINAETTFAILGARFLGGDEEVARTILLRARWELLQCILASHPPYLTEFLVAFRKCLLKFHGALKPELMPVLKPYGKKQPEDNPAALKAWVATQLALRQSDSMD